jgi:hypothetical protein
LRKEEELLFGGFASEWFGGSGKTQIPFGNDKQKGVVPDSVRE